MGEQPRTDRPEYDRVRAFREHRDARAEGFARQIIATVEPRSGSAPRDWLVLDLGSGYGGTARALARQVSHVVAYEPTRLLHETAVAEATSMPAEERPEHYLAGVEDLVDVDRFDLIVLDNVYEHLPDPDLALRHIHRALKPGGALYVLVPNKAWPVEAHYGLVGLSWLPPRLADGYLRMTGRGTSYADSAYAPTYWGLRRRLQRAGLVAEFVVPGDLASTVAQAPWHYRVGVRALRRVPALWAISKALLVVATKPDADA